MVPLEFIELVRQESEEYIYTISNQQYDHGIDILLSTRFTNR